jgi:hypothetical protein
MTGVGVSQDITAESEKSTIVQVSSKQSTIFVFNEDIAEYSAEGTPNVQAFDERQLSGGKVITNTLVIDPFNGVGALFVRTVSAKDYHFLLEAVDIPSKFIYVNKGDKIGGVESEEWEKSSPYEYAVISLINSLIEGGKYPNGYKVVNVKREISFSFSDSDGKRKKDIPVVVDVELQGRKMFAYKIVAKTKDVPLERRMFDMKGILGVTIIGDDIYLVTKKGFLNG